MWLTTFYAQVLSNQTAVAKVWMYPAYEELMKMDGRVGGIIHVRLRE